MDNNSRGDGVLVPVIKSFIVVVKKGTKFWSFWSEIRNGV